MELLTPTEMSFVMRAGDVAEVPYILAARKLVQAMDIIMLKRATIVLLALEIKETIKKSDVSIIQLDDEYHDAFAEIETLLVSVRNCTHVTQYASDTLHDLLLGLPEDMSQKWFTTKAVSFQNAVDMYSKDMEECDKIFNRLTNLRAEMHLAISHSDEIAHYDSKLKR
jgi:hypothetical protein